MAARGARGKQRGDVLAVRQELGSKVLAYLLVQSLLQAGTNLCLNPNPEPTHFHMSNPTRAIPPSWRAST